MPRADGRQALILGRYVLHGEIASGGMAAVCFGRMVGAAGFVRTVAIKRLHAHLVHDPEFSAMFLDEARLAARVRHPSVVSTLDVVAAEDELLLVMEYVAGESLAALQRSLGVPAVMTQEAQSPPALPPDVAASIVSGVLHGLHAAHEARAENGLPLEIVHRDVSPHNIIVGEDGVARLIDFGIARAAVRSHSTQVGQLKGKLRYMAPEQLLGAPATRRADIYAAAVVLWEALTGQRLFDGESDGAIYGRILEGVVHPPSAFAAVPPALDPVVLRGLARDPQARYPTALEMAEVLERAITPAPAREVAAWLQRIAGPVLAQRAQRVREIEHDGAEGGPRSLEAPPPDSLRAGEGTLTDRRPASDEGLPPDAEPPTLLRPRSDLGVADLAAATKSLEGTATATATVMVPVPPPGRLPPTRLPARGGVLAVGAGLSLALAIVLGARAAERPTVPAARAGVAAAVLLASLRVSTAAGPSAPFPAAPSASGADPTPPPVAKRASPPSSSRPRSLCDPPYYTDGTGIRRVKRECL